MGPGVSTDGMAFRRDPAHQFRVFRRRLSDQEERRAHAFMGQRRQHLRRGRGPRSVIESEHYLVVSERQRLRKALESDPRGWAASTASMREVPSASLRGQDAAWAAALPATAARTMPSTRAGIEAHFGRSIFIIALGVALWLMREPTAQIEFFIPVKSARRGMTEDMDIAQPADAAGARPSPHARRKWRNSPRIRRGDRRMRFTKPIRSCCARSWRNCTRPISAI